MYGNPVKRVQFILEFVEGRVSRFGVCVFDGGFNQPHLAQSESGVG